MTGQTPTSCLVGLPFEESNPEPSAHICRCACHYTKGATKVSRDIGSKPPLKLRFGSSIVTTSRPAPLILFVYSYQNHDARSATARVVPRPNHMKVRVVHTSVDPDGARTPLRMLAALPPLPTHSRSQRGLLARLCLGCIRGSRSSGSLSVVYYRCTGQCSKLLPDKKFVASHFTASGSFIW